MDGQEETLKKQRNRSEKATVQIADTSGIAKGCGAYRRLPYLTLAYFGLAWLVVYTCVCNVVCFSRPFLIFCF